RAHPQRQGRHRRRSPAPPRRDGQRRQPASARRRPAPRRRRRRRARRPGDLRALGLQLAARVGGCPGGGRRCPGAARPDPPLGLMDPLSLLPAVIVFAIAGAGVAVLVWALRRRARSPKAQAAAEERRTLAGSRLVALDDAVDELDLEVGLSGALYGGD